VLGVEAVVGGGDEVGAEVGAGVTESDGADWGRGVAGHAVEGLGCGEVYLGLVGVGDAGGTGDEAIYHAAWGGAGEGAGVAGADGSAELFSAGDVAVDNLVGGDADLAGGRVHSAGADAVVGVHGAAVLVGGKLGGGEGGGEKGLGDRDGRGEIRF